MVVTVVTWNAIVVEVDDSQMETAIHHVMMEATEIGMVQQKELVEMTDQ